MTQRQILQQLILKYFYTPMLDLHLHTEGKPACCAEYCVGFWVLMLGYKLFKADWVCSARWQVDPLPPTKGLWVSQRFHKVMFSGVYGTYLDTLWEWLISAFCPRQETVCVCACVACVRACVGLCVSDTVMNSHGLAKSTVEWCRFHLHRCFSAVCLAGRPTKPFSSLC